MPSQVPKLGSRPLGHLGLATGHQGFTDELAHRQPASTPWTEHLFAEALFRHGRKTERPEAAAARKQKKQNDLLFSQFCYDFLVLFSVLLCLNVIF